MTNMSYAANVEKTNVRSIRASSINAKVVKTHKRSFISAVARTTGIFCEESTFHGLKHLCLSARGLRTRNLSKSKRATNLVSTILWLTACGLGFSFAVVLIHLVWNRFQSTPTITTIETNNYPIWNVPYYMPCGSPFVNVVAFCTIEKLAEGLSAVLCHCVALSFLPFLVDKQLHLKTKRKMDFKSKTQKRYIFRFPAVTLCNVNKVHRPAIKNITDKLLSRGLKEERIEQFFSNLSKLVQPEYVDDVYAQTLAILTELNYTTEKLMFEIMQPCSIMLESCIWLSKIVPCETIFRVAKSSEGFCCSFNYNALKNSLEVNNEIVSVFEQLDDPVHRVSGAGQFVSLEVLLRVSMAQYVAYTRSYYGISVLIHSPEDYPQASATTTIAQPGCDVIVAIIPSVVVSEPSVRTLALKQRHCFFEDEKKLRTTEKYTFQSCITECAVDTIVKQCGCLPFYYSEIHLKDFAGKTRQCNLKDVGCLRDNRHIISSLQPLSVTNETVGMNCPECLPSCSEERYDVQTTIAKRFEGDNLTSSYYSGKNLSNHVTLKVHFKDVTCLKYRRDIFMTWDGFLASFGGIFGLCLGGSLISFIEIFYFFSLKLYASYHGMVETAKPTPEDYNKEQNEINIFKIATFPSDDTLTMHLKFRNQSKIPTNHLFDSVSHDRYLD